MVIINRINCHEKIQFILSNENLNHCSVQMFLREYAEYNVWYRVIVILVSVSACNQVVSGLISDKNFSGILLKGTGFYYASEGDLGSAGWKVQNIIKLAVKYMKWLSVNQIIHLHISVKNILIPVVRFISVTERFGFVPCLNTALCDNCFME